MKTFRFLYILFLISLSSSMFGQNIALESDSATICLVDVATDKPLKCLDKLIPIRFLLVEEDGILRHEMQGEEYVYTIIEKNITENELNLSLRNLLNEVFVWNLNVNSGKITFVMQKDENTNIFMYLKVKQIYEVRSLD